MVRSLDSTIGCFPPLAACITPSGTVEARLHGDFLVSSSSAFPSPVSQVSGAFSSRAFLTLSLGRQPGAKAISLCCLGSILYHLEQKFLMPGTTVLLTYGFYGEFCQPTGNNFMRVCVCVYCFLGPA